MPLKQLTKEGVKYAVYGCLGEVGRRLRTATAPILTYHSLDETGSRMSLRPESFRRQMQYLNREGFTSLTLAEYAAARKQRRSLPERAFVLTFDDGFGSVYDVAFPTLTELGFTATIFPVTGFVGQRCGWDIDPVSRRLGADQLELMTWPQIKEMCDCGFEFGSHGTRHLHLAEEPAAIVREDLTNSQRELEDRLGRECSAFCYPYGEYTASTRDIVADCGFEAAVTLRFGWNDANEDPLRLRRIGSARFTNMQVFKASLYRMYGWHLKDRHGRR